MVQPVSPNRAVTTEDVLLEVASATRGASAGRFVLHVVDTLRRQGRSRITRAEIEGLLAASRLSWSAMSVPRGGNVCEVIVRGPRRTADVALVEGWLARGLANRLDGATPDERRRTFDDLVPVADHLRLLTPYDPYRMLGSFLDGELVLEAFESLTDAIIKDARALAQGRASRLRAVITQRIESLVRVLPPSLRAPFEERIRQAGGDPSIPVLLDAALGVVSERSLPPAAAPKPAPEPEPDTVDVVFDRDPVAAPIGGPMLSEATDGPPEARASTVPPSLQIEGRLGGAGPRTIGRILLWVTGLALLRGLGRALGRALLGLRHVATLSTGPGGITIAERTWLLGKVVREAHTAVGAGGLTLLRVERRTALFVVLCGLLGGTVGAAAGLYVFLDGIRGEYVVVMGFGLVLIGGGVAADFAALWFAERMGGRASLVLRTAEGRWLRLTALDPDWATRFVRASKGFLAG